MLNKALLCEWNWQYAIEKGAFRTQVISGKYGEEEGGWWSNEVREGLELGFGNLLGKSGAISFAVPPL